MHTLAGRHSLCCEEYPISLGTIGDSAGDELPKVTSAEAKAILLGSRAGVVMLLLADYHGRACSLGSK